MHATRRLTAVVRRSRLLREGAQVVHVTRRFIASLEAKPAPFNATRLELAPDTSCVEANELETLVEAARRDGKSAVWISLQGAQTASLRAVLQAGFEIHSGKADAVNCYRWLADHEDKVPAYATTNFGVAGVVTNADNEVLVVKDRGKRSSWKFPGGFVDAGEDLTDAVAREVLEETGVEAEAQQILAIRHQHGTGSRRDIGDAYALIHMRARTTGIDIRHTEEIEEAKWTDLDEFAATCEHPMNKYVAELAIQAIKRPEASIGLVPDQVGTLADPAKKVRFYRPAASPRC